MGNNPQLLSARLGAFLRRRETAKGLARRIRCDRRTAENIMSGHWPGARHWLGILNAFGRDVTDAVFHPDDAASRLEEEVERLERQLAETRVRAAEVKSFAPGAGGSVATAPAVGGSRRPVRRRPG